MQCANCGYRMRDAEQSCLCCGTARPAVSPLQFPMPPPPTYCPQCGLKHEGGDPYCRTCAFLLPPPGRRPSPLAALPARVVVAVVVAVVVSSLCLLAFQSVARRQQAAAFVAARAAELARQRREARLAQTLQRLRDGNPTAAFGRYPGDNAGITFRMRLSGCDVRGLLFSHTEGSDQLSVNVGLLGYRAEGQAPKVYVSLYGEQGALLSRKAVVSFVFASLGQGETREVQDTMDYPGDGDAAFVSVDSNDKPPMLPIVPAPAAPPAGYSPVGYLQGMKAYVADTTRLGCVVYWPHDGDPDTLGVLFPRSRFLDTDAKTKAGVVREVGENFALIRRSNHREGFGHLIVRFEGSKGLWTADLKPGE